MGRWLAYGCIGVVAACSSFGGTTPDPSGDAGPATIPDSGSDTAPDTRRFCERLSDDGGAPPIYCRDFDRPNEVATFDWDSKDGPLKLDTVEAVSPPGSLLLRLEANATLCGYARGIRKLGPAPERFRVAFDVRRGGADTVPTVEVSYLTVRFGGADPSSECLLIFKGNDSNGYVQEQSAPVNPQHKLSKFPLEKRWFHLDVDVDRKTRALDVHVDGEPGFLEAQTLGAACLADREQLWIIPGFHCEFDDKVPKEVRLDNIVVTARP